MSGLHRATLKTWPGESSLVSLPRLRLLTGIPRTISPHPTMFVSRLCIPRYVRLSRPSALSFPVLIFLPVPYRRSSLVSPRNHATAPGAAAPRTCQTPIPKLSLSLWLRTFHPVRVHLPLPERVLGCTSPHSCSISAILSSLLTSPAQSPFRRTTLTAARTTAVSLGRTTCHTPSPSLLIRSHGFSFKLQIICALSIPGTAWLSRSRASMGR